MVNGVLYFTAGTRRDVIAADAATGETLWMYRLDEGERGAKAVRVVNRGVSYWTDNRGDERIILLTLGYHMVELNAKTGVPIAAFGTNGIVDLEEGLDRENIKPGIIGATSPAMIAGDVVVVGSALGTPATGSAPPSMNNVPGLRTRVRCANRQTHLDLPYRSRRQANSATKPGRKAPGNTRATPPFGRP